MSNLSISLLGSFHVALDGAPVSRFGADTARALLAYLSMHPGVAHRRVVLAGLLWPEQPDADALRNLRVALSRLRDAIGDREADPSFLLVSRTSIELNPQAAVSLDVRTYRALLAATKGHGHERLESCALCARRLGEAAALYRGEFLAGFSLHSAPFEEWLVVEREGLHWQALQVLGPLAAFHEGQGEYQEAIAYARRQVELEPWHEGAHRQWMRALALSGHRGAALAQYEACRRVLSEELGVEPEEQTRALYERIRESVLQPPLEEVVSPPPAQSIAEPVPAPRAVEAELVASPVLGQVEGERRSVTTLFARVEPVATEEGALDIEARAEAVSGALWLVESEVGRLGGEVSQRRGDGLVATFGATTAHEDDPERAVLAALAIEDAVRRYAADVARREGMDLRVRIGISSGEAIVTRVGNGGAQRVETALGEGASLGDQLLELAGTEGALVAAQTYRLVAPLFDWQAVGERALAGAKAPVTVYRPLVRRPEVSKGRGIAGLTSPLVGRERELSALQRAVERLQAGSGGIVTVVGEAGLGKSRLIAEVRKGTGQRRGGSRTAPTQRAVQWVEGRCLSYGGTVAYVPWLDMLRGVVRLAADAAPAQARDALRGQVRALCGDRTEEVYPYLGRVLSLPLEEDAQARLRGLDAEGLRVLTFRAAQTLLEHAAQQRPLVVVCEDLHWADPTSLALLEQMLTLTDQVPVLFVCVLRPETEHGCWLIREVAARDYRHRHVDLWLEPLSEDESERLVRSLLEGEGLPRALRERVVRYTEGNPLYLEEVLRALIAEGALAYNEETACWRAVRAVDELSVPDTLNGVLMARIDRLARGSQQVLQLAAVIGHVFAYRMLAAVVGQREGLDEHLVLLQRAQMIREQARVPEIEYAFHHQLTMEAAYSSLLRRKRRVLHHRVAEALERLYADRIEERLGLLAYHWEQAGEAEQAVHYLRRAGERAAAQYANQEAITYFARALSLVPPEDAGGRYGLLLVREAVYDLQGDRQAQYQDLTALRKLADVLADTRRQAEVALRQANYDLRVGDYQAGAADAQRAVSLAQAGAEASIEAAAHREWGRALFYQQDYEAARLQVERALAMARELSLDQVRADSLHTLGAIFDDLGAYADAKVYFGEELSVCHEMGDRRGEGVALRDLGLASVYLGDREGAETWLQQSLRICREVGNRRDEAWALVGLGDASSFYGDYSRAKTYHQEAVSLCRETRARLGEARSLVNLGQVSWALGAYREALHYLEQSLRVACDLAYLGLQGWALLSVGGVYAELGQYGKARECLEQSLHIAREWGEPRAEGYTLPHLALVFHYLDDDQLAWQHAQAALRLRRHFVGLFIAGYALTALGHVLVDLGHLDEAADAYRQALQLRRRINQHHLVVAPLAGLLEVAIRQGDRLQAQALVEEVLGELNARPVPEGTTEPFRVHLSAYRALRAKDDARAGQVLHTAHRLLCKRAARIEDEEMRRSFLEDVPAHREIVDAFAQGL